MILVGRRAPHGTRPARTIERRARRAARLAPRWPSLKFLSTSSRSSLPRLGAARDRREGGGDRAAALVAGACRDRGRARRIRQDDAAGAGGPKLIRVRSRGSRSTARTPTRGVPALHRGRDPPRRAGARRGVPRAVGPGRIDVVEAGAARRERVGGARATAGAGARRSARRPQSVVPGCPRGTAGVPPGGLADGDREPGGARAPARPVARARIGPRDRCGGPAARRAGGRAAAGGGGRAPGRRASSPS